MKTFIFLSSLHFFNMLVYAYWLNNYHYYAEYNETTNDVLLEDLIHPLFLLFYIKASLQSYKVIWST